MKYAARIRQASASMTHDIPDRILAIILANRHAQMPKITIRHCESNEKQLDNVVLDTNMVSKAFSCYLLCDCAGVQQIASRAAFYIHGVASKSNTLTSNYRITLWIGDVVVIGIVINRLRVRLPAVHSWVSTWMGDCLWAGKPPLYVSGHL